jgi:hypothetical protein
VSPHAHAEDRCAHCGKRIRSDIHTIITEGTIAGIPLTTVAAFHDDRRACRVAAHEYPESTWTPPERTDQMDTSVFGAALIGFDYVRWPWWLRWVPDSWLDGLRSEVAMKVGGAVERGQAWQSASGEPDD